MTGAQATATYRSLLAAPGVIQAFVAASLGRLSFGMGTLALLFAAQQATGSFTVAGIVLGAYSIGNLSAPFKARLLDRRGQPFALTLLGLPYTAALLGYAAAAASDVRGPGVYVTLGAVAGLAAPPVGSAMRALWASATPDPRTRGRAYSLDVAVEETLLVSGPVLTGALIAVSGPLLAVVVTALTMLASCLGLATSSAARRLRVLPRDPENNRLLGPLTRPGFLVMLVAVAGTGLTLGVIDIAVAASAERRDVPDAAGYVLAALSLGSAVGGIVWGRLAHRNSLRVRLAALLATFATGTAVAAAAPNLVVLGVVLALTGVALAPALVTSYLMAEGLSHASQRTEATTWVNNAINIGAGLGAATAGFVVENVLPQVSFLVGAAILLPPLLVLLANRPRLARADEYAESAG
jgi:MFS family permease